MSYLAGENATGLGNIGGFEIVIDAGTRCDCKYWACFARLFRPRSGSLGVVPCMGLTRGGGKGGRLRDKLGSRIKAGERERQM